MAAVGGNETVSLPNHTHQIGGGDAAFHERVVSKQLDPDDAAHAVECVSDGIVDELADD